MQFRGCKYRNKLLEFSQLQEMQQKMQESKERLSLIRGTGEAASSAVKVTMDGNRKMISIDMNTSREAETMTIPITLCRQEMILLLFITCSAARDVSDTIR